MDIIILITLWKRVVVVIFLLLGAIAIIVSLMIMFYMALFKAAAKEDEYLAKYSELGDEE